jgi:methyl-accepting chemotaxis protein WspA
VYAENARKSINSSLELINRVRQSEGSTQKVKASMDNMYNLLGEYESVFQFSVDEVSRVNTEKSAVESRISNQKLGLKTIGDSFINSSSKLSENSWRSINNESAQLAKSGSDAQYLLSIVAIAGVVMGLLVLFIVPRPILNGISQLLSSAQQVASGNLGAEIHINSNDELGVLGKTFEHMRQNLFVLVQRIQRASVQISSSVNEIQAASNQQSSTATEQASAVNQFSRSLEQISQNASTLVEATSDVADSSDKVASMVADSNSQAGQMMDSMNSIGESTKQTSARIKMLNEQMDSISETVSEISMIADQTTLLALNAAIEANKAGEMGKGFSVVATEIRRLSDRSIESASGIASIVKDIQRNTESSVVAMEKSSEEIKSGVNLVHNTSTNMSSINHSISQVSGKSKQILRSVRAQSESSSSVRSSATELLQSANMVSQAARQTNAISYELNSMANQLASAVSAFKL